MSYNLSPFGQLCLIQQPPPLSSQPTPAVRITALPPKNPRNPIWAEDCCMNCAKLVGSADLFCVPCSEKGKCIRCFNLNLRCESVRENYESFFREVQQYFQFYDLQTAFEARKAWFNRMDGTYGLLSIALFDNALGMLNRNLEQLINLQREKGCKPPVDADREADEEPKQRLEIQAHREHITELEGLVAQETARYGMQTNKKLKIKSGRRVERLKLDLAQAKASLAELEADEVA